MQPNQRMSDHHHCHQTRNHHSHEQKNASCNDHHHDHKDHSSCCNHDHSHHHEHGEQQENKEQDQQTTEQKLFAVPQYRETLEYQHKDYQPLHPDIYTLDPEKHLHPTFLQVVQQCQQLAPVLIEYQQLSKAVFLMEEEAEKKFLLEKEEAEKQKLSQPELQEKDKKDNKEEKNEDEEQEEEEEEEEYELEFTEEQLQVRDQFLQVQKLFNSTRRDILSQWLTLEVSPDVYSFDLFTSEFCVHLLEEVQHFSRTVDEIFLRPNSMNNFGVVCDEMGLNRFFDSFVCDYFSHVARILNRGAWILDDHHSFIVEYKARGVGDVKLNLHVDDSELTLNVCLGREGFEGGAVFFQGKVDNPRSMGTQYAEYDHVIGRAIMHDGSHMHGATVLTKGERYNLIMWLRSSAKRKGTESRINFHVAAHPDSNTQETS